MKLFPAVLLSLTLAAPAVAADAPVKLYKFYGAKDELVIGLTAAELNEMANESDPKGPNDIPRKPGVGDVELDMIGDRLVGIGHLKAWQYGPRRGSDGAAEWAPLRRVLLIGAHIYRVETQQTGDRIVAPPN